MKNKSIKLRTLPSQKNRSTAWIVAVIFVVIFSYFVPGLHYLLDVRTHLVQRLSLNIVIPLLLCFYLLIFIVFYRIIFELFSKNAVLEISEANVLTLFVNGYGKLVINKDQLEINKKCIKVLGQEKFGFMFKNKDIAALLREKLVKVDDDQHYSEQKSFIGGFRSLVQLSVYSTFLLIFYIVTAFYGHKFVTPYIADLQILFRAKGALLMIIISIPLIFFYLSFAYYFFTKIVFRKKGCEI